MIHSVSQLESETSKREFMQACPDIASLWGFLSCFSGDQSRSGVQAAASPDPYVTNQLAETLVVSQYSTVISN